MAKFIAERHFTTKNGIVKPGEEVEIDKGSVDTMKERGWISDVPKKTSTKKETDSDK